MSAIRIVVAEDSPTARQLLVEIFREDPALSVVGEARDGVEAVELTQRLRPDLVTMDIHMPRMDGLAATERIMSEVPTPVVVVSTLVDRDIQTSMNALRAGALAVLQKLVGPGSPDFEGESQRLRDTIKAMARVKVVQRWPQPPKRLLASRAVDGQRAPAEIVAIVASTGGPAVLQAMLSELPGTFPLPILIVQHIALGFAVGFASWLAESGALRVKVAEVGEPLRKGTVYVAPDDRHLGVTSSRAILLSSEAPLGGFRPSGTFLFRSVASVFNAGIAAVVLTGMGRDGVDGLRAVRDAGGLVLAQDESSSVVFGMPGAAVESGLADEILPADRLAARLVALRKE